MPKKMSNYGEPWDFACTYTDETCLPLEPGEKVRAIMSREVDVCYMYQCDSTEARGQRIVACVNACADIEDPALLRRQRDELLDVCKRFHSSLDNWYDGPESHLPSDLIDAWQVARKAISNCTPSPALDSGAGQTSGPASDLGHIPVPDDESLVSERLNEEANGL